MKSLFTLILFLLFSCRMQEGELLFVQDVWQYRTYEYYFDTQFKLDTAYRLDRRYFVFNYSDNQERFDSVVSVLVCRALNDSFLLSHLYFDLQDYGRGASPDTSLNSLSADFTPPLVVLKWDILEPKVLRLEWDGTLRENEVVNFNCELNPIYAPYLK